MVKDRLRHINIYTEARQTLSRLLTRTRLCENTMRWLALLPAVLCTVSLILAFLCLFAGSSPSFLNDYSVVTVGIPDMRRYHTFLC